MADAGSPAFGEEAQVAAVGEAAAEAPVLPAEGMEDESEAAEAGAAAASAPAPPPPEVAAAPPPPPPPQDGIASESAEGAAAAAAAAATTTGVSLNGRRFGSAHDLIAALKELQGGLEDDAELSGAEAFMVYELLTYHPTVADKVKSGAVALGWGVNPKFPDTRSFFCRLASGEKVAWSARKCVDAIFPKAGDDGGQRDAKRKREREARETASAPAGRTRFPPGSILQLSNLPPGCRIYDVKKLFVDHEVRYVEIVEPEDPDEDNRPTAIARFGSAAAAAAAAAADIPTDDLGPSIEVAVATEDVEVAVWARMQEAHEAKRLRMERDNAPPQIKMVPGCLLHVTSLSPETNDVHTLKRVFGADRNVRYVETLDDGAALIRFNSPEDCTASAGISDVDGTAVTVAVAEGDVEKGFWDRMQAAVDARAARDRERGGRGGRGGGWKGRGGGYRKGGGWKGRNSRRGGY